MPVHNDFEERFVSRLSGLCSWDYNKPDGQQSYENGPGGGIGNGHGNPGGGGHQGNGGDYGGPDSGGRTPNKPSVGGSGGGRTPGPDDGTRGGQEPNRPVSNGTSQPPGTGSSAARRHVYSSYGRGRTGDQARDEYLAKSSAAANNMPNGTTQWVWDFYGTVIPNSYDAMVNMARGVTENSKTECRTTCNDDRKLTFDWLADNLHLSADIRNSVKKAASIKREVAVSVVQTVMGRYFHFDTYGECLASCESIEYSVRWNKNTGKYYVVNEPWNVPQ